MYDINPKPNSDQVYCPNCDMIVDEKSITETCEGDKGCTECIENCGNCGKSHFIQDMYSCPYVRRVCNACKSDEGYLKYIRDTVIQEALGCLFDQTPSRQIERIIVDVARGEGFTDLSHELKGDKTL